jgi:hypothetical protein
VQEVAALDLLVADPGVEDERVIAGAVRADLTCVGEVLEHLRHRGQDRGHGLAAPVRLEDDRTPEQDVLREQRCDGVEVSCFDGAAERMHGCLLYSTN